MKYDLIRLTATIASLIGAALLGASMKTANAQEAKAGDIVGHVIAGYQGWFAEPGDASPIGNLPAGRGNYHANYETYPDLREFPDSELFAPPQPWNALPDGSPAKLFSSDRDFTADLHTRWMKQYGVDVAAIQRFGEVASDSVYAAQKNNVTRRMLRASEKNGVKLYIEYDTSGSAHGGWGPDFVEGIKKDWNGFAVGEKIIGSPAYARQNGKPVVELWGMGLHDNNISTDPAQWLALLHWFHAQGVYVIAGTATGWRTATRDAVAGFDEVYTACDAINPWIVGRFGSVAGADSYANDLMKPDLAWCREHHIDYIPCVFPGTAFFNSNHKSKNVIPRRNGALMWRQFANLRNAGISTCFVSMFDEYNEATAIAKSAEDASRVPAGQYFLTLDADGASLSSDFYLRLTADASKMLKGETPLQWTLPTPPRNDLFATTFATGQPQPLTNGPRKGDSKNVVDARVAISADGPPAGMTALLFSGTARGGAATLCRYKLFDFAHQPLTLDAHTLLHYAIRPQDANSRYVAIDLHFTDGTTLAASGCTDQNSASLSASAGHGGAIPLNAWSSLTAHLGALSGKKIDSLWIVFDHVGSEEKFQASIANLELSH